jgi:hypothetical protein
MDDRDLLLEQVIAAWRARDRDGGPRSHPAWHDLSPADRAHAARIAAAQRTLEAALDPNGLSTTAHAVLARIREGS